MRPLLGFHLSTEQKLVHGVLEQEPAPPPRRAQRRTFAPDVPQHRALRRVAAHRDVAAHQTDDGEDEAAAAHQRIAQKPGRLAPQHQPVMTGNTADQKAHDLACGPSAAPCNPITR